MYIHISFEQGSFLNVYFFLVIQPTLTIQNNTYDTHILHNNILTLFFFRICEVYSIVE